jgi:hypothetical protein
MANSKELLKNGMTEQSTISEDPGKYGMDNMADTKNQKPMPTPKQKVAEKGKSFTIC